MSLAARRAFRALAAVTRGSLNCDLLHSWLRPPGSASCLRASGTTYQVPAKASFVQTCAFTVKQ